MLSVMLYALNVFKNENLDHGSSVKCFGAMNVTNLKSKIDLYPDR